MGFKKGRRKTGGRQLGQPNRVAREIKTHAREVIENPDYQAKLRQRLLDGSAPQLEVLLHYYAYGKPKLEIDMGQRVTVLVQRSAPQPIALNPILGALPDRNEEPGHDDAA